MKLFNLTETNFENFDNTINNYLNKVFLGLGIQNSKFQLFTIIFNAIKGIMQNIMVYIEDAFTEQNIETAVRQKSIYSLAKLSGYEPFYGTAATGILKASLISSTNLSQEIKKIYINNHSTIQCINNGFNYILYLQTDRYVFDVEKPLVDYDFRIIQGFFNEANYTSNGEELETIHLTINGMFDKNYIKVYVNNVEWQPVSNLYDMTENGKEYIISVGFDNELDITFGNGIYGKVPSNGDNIKVEYIVHNGTNGNISNLSDIQFKFITNGVDFYGNSIDLNNYIKLDLEAFVSGGTNSDTIYDVKNMIGYNSRSNVLASIDNYILFLKHFSFLGNFNIWAEDNSNTLVINGITNVLNDITDINEYKNIQDKELLLTDEQKSNIMTVLENSSNTFAGVNISFLDPIICKYAVMYYVQTDDPFYRDIVKNNLEIYTLEYFSKYNFNVTFISKSDILKYILDNVSHIKSINIEIISEINENAYGSIDHSYYKYTTYVYNNKVKYKTTKYFYEDGQHLGLDELGNISLDSNIYLPLLQGNFKYYPNKSNGDTSNITVDAVNVIFI